MFCGLACAPPAVNAAITAAKTASTKGDIQSTMSSLTSDVASASKALATLQAKAKQLAGVDVSPLMASLNQVTAHQHSLR